MPGEVPGLPSRRLGGVRHAPEADIESIRDLLRGYGSPRSILKELIQNAEDPGASQMDILFVPGDPASAHTLLRGPGLLVANDGPFTPEDRDAITQLNLGTKGTQERAIGRFGKGLKSVFSWCDAFYIISRTDPRLGWPATRIVDFFNPWHNWKHQEWEEEFSAHSDDLITAAELRLNVLYPEQQPWLAFWFPLRLQKGYVDGQSSADWILQDFPGDDRAFFSKIKSKFRELVPSLVCLRHIEQISITDHSADSATPLTFQFRPDSQRIPEPDEFVDTESISGIIELSDAKTESRVQYSGLAGHLQNDTVTQLKARKDWPSVVQRIHGANSASVPVKGQPHFAALVSWSQEGLQSEGSLDIQWCVFFPVGKQPPDNLPIRLRNIPYLITLNLHGFFFLDSDRLRIDGLEEHFDQTGPGSRGACLEWNRLLASEGTLAQVPRALAEFAERTSLPNGQCVELTQAIRQAWLWTNFEMEICRTESWRPRWRSGEELWKCIPVDDPVYRIPNSSHKEQLRDCIPMLASVSEEFNLVARGNNEDPVGLYYGGTNAWPEDLVIRLLQDVKIDTATDEPAVHWLNSFLSQLRVEGSLTPKILVHVSRFTLLSVRNIRTNKRERISAQEWDERGKDSQLFSFESASRSLVALLAVAFPEWFCLSFESEPPLWFPGLRPPILDAAKAAHIGLSQNTQGSFADREALFQYFASLPAITYEGRLLLRFLMHGSASHSRDDKKQLFVPSTQAREQIWARLIKQVLEQYPDDEAWRLVEVEWAPLLSPHLQRDLNVATFDADSAWSELTTTRVNFENLVFTPDDWSTKEICELMGGLFQEANPDKSIELLRKLPIHFVRTVAARVLIGDAEGELNPSFILDTPGFPSDLPNELQPLWQAFRSEVQIVERLPARYVAASSIQRKLFTLVDADGDYAAELNWKYVVRHCLSVANPSEFAPLIMEALKQDGDRAVSGIGSTLKDTKWLPLTLGGSIAPSSLVNIEGIESDLLELLDPEKDGLAGVRSLREWVIAHPGFSTLRNYFSRPKEAFRLLGMWLDEKPDWHLGLTRSFDSSELDLLLSQIQDIEILPMAGLLAKVRKVRGRPENEIDALVREFILPAISKPFDDAQNGAVRIKRILLRLQTSQTRFAFDVYLAQVCKERIIESVLPSLSLVNQLEQWKPAGTLIWPSSNLDPGAQLCAAQARILSPLWHGADQAAEPVKDGGTHAGAIGIQAARSPDFVDEAAKLKEYLVPFRESNVGDILPAALVAVLGGHTETLGLLKELLQAGFIQQPDDFLAMLIGEQGEDPHEREALVREIRSVGFTIEVARGDFIEAATITGGTIQVSLTPDVHTLIVGDPGELFFTYSHGGTMWRRIRLRWIQDPNQLSEALDVFASTVDTIFYRAHCAGNRSLCPRNIRERLGGVADVGQADLRRSQLFLLDMAENRLNELGVKGQPEFDSVLKKFAQARQKRVEADSFEKGSPILARKRREEAKDLTDLANQELVQILESNPNDVSRKMLVKAVRRKMTDFQYDIESIPLELFQNADDAVVELNEMQGRIDPDQEKFVLRLDGENRVFEIMHWGRAINQHHYPGFSEGYQRGYDKDLQKMLTLSSSDKGIDTENPAIVTGRFGLGFKSAFFISEQPEIVSGRLAFEIFGGFYPVYLLLEKARQLRESAADYGKLQLTPTVIRLKWSEETGTDAIGASVERFMKVSPLLTIFARGIRTIVITQGADSTSWVNVEKPIIENGRIQVVQIGNTSYLCFKCSLRNDKTPATILFQLDSNGISQLPSDLTGVWITTPTAQRSELPWALNAPFKPDAGRQQLALKNLQNREIADSISEAWGNALVELFDETSDNWTAFASKVGLHANASHQKWWQQVWTNTTRRSPVLRWEDMQHGGEVLAWIAWNGSWGAMRWLIQHRPATPTHLPPPYARLVKLSDIQFCVSGLLAEIDNGCFSHVSEWTSFIEAVPPGQIINANTKTFLDEAKFAPTMKLVNLASVLNVEVGIQRCANPETADRIGWLLKKCSPILQGGENHAPELQDLYRRFKEVKMLAEDGGYYPASDLICGHGPSALIDPDERLRATFAPHSSVLSTVYSEPALGFFVKAREQLTATADTLALWVRDSMLAALPAIFVYLVKGELGQQLADRLEKPWLEGKRHTAAWQDLSPSEKSEIERKFLKGSVIDFSTILPGIQPPVPPPDDIQYLMDPEEALRLISKWWKAKGKAFTSQYEQKTYPSGFTGKLPWPGEDGWDEDERLSGKAQWLMVFIHALLVPLGLNMIGRNQQFSQFLVSDDWLDTLANVSDHPEEVLAGLDRYLNKDVQDTVHHFQMRQFIAFYAVAQNLEPLLLSIKETERSTGAVDFSLALAPKANPALRGTGIDAPPLTEMLGIGSCQLFRELYRLGRLKNTAGYRLAFTPIRKVRRLCQIFRIPEGPASLESAEIIFKTLNDLAVPLGLDPTFNHCFDLPLQYLAENPLLRAAVLKTTFELDASDNSEDSGTSQELM